MDARVARLIDRLGQQVIAALVVQAGFVDLLESHAVELGKLTERVAELERRLNDATSDD